MDGNIEVELIGSKYRNTEVNFQLIKRKIISCPLVPSHTYIERLLFLSTKRTDPINPGGTMK